MPRKKKIFNHKPDKLREETKRLMKSVQDGKFKSFRAAILSGHSQFSRTALYRFDGML